MTCMHEYDVWGLGLPPDMLGGGRIPQKRFRKSSMELMSQRRCCVPCDACCAELLYTVPY